MGNAGPFFETAPVFLELALQHPHPPPISNILKNFF